MKRLSWPLIGVIAAVLIVSAFGIRVYKSCHGETVASSPVAQTATPSARPVVASKSPSAVASASVRASASASPKPSASAVMTGIHRSQIVASCGSNNTPALDVEVRTSGPETRIAVSCKTGPREWSATTDPLEPKNYSGVIRVRCEPPVVKVSAARCGISNL